MVLSYSKFDTCLQSSTGVTILLHFIISKAVACDMCFKAVIFSFKIYYNVNQQVYKSKYLNLFQIMIIDV